MHYDKIPNQGTASGVNQQVVTPRLSLMREFSPRKNMLVTSEETIGLAWLRATEALLDEGGDAFTSIVHVKCPLAVGTAESSLREQLDRFLGAAKLGDTQTIANTIFPEATARLGAQQLYSRYEERVWPVIRRLRQNSRGTYFRRMTRLETRGSSGAIEVRNPLADTINKMRVQLKRASPLRCAYELSIYRAEADANIGMGFPCLSHVSFKLDRGRVHLTAFYRNQLYIGRLYGNLLGLARLQNYIAQQIELDAGELVCHAAHAQIDPGVRRQQLHKLIKRCRAVLAIEPNESPDSPDTVKPG